MKEVYEAFGKLKNLVEEVQHYMQLAVDNDKDDPLEVILPFGYQYLTKREDIIPDQHILFMAGSYFAIKYPHLKEHFMSERQKQSHATIEQLITQQLDETSTKKE